MSLGTILLIILIITLLGGFGTWPAGGPGYGYGHGLNGGLGLVLVVVLILILLGHI